MGGDEDIRKKIIDAAAELFAEHGYEGVGVRQVAQMAGVTQYRVRSLTGGRQDLFAAVVAERVTSDAAARIARAVDAAGDTPPLAAIVDAGAEVYARPERSWDILELEAMTRAHRDADLREVEAQRIQKRWDNMSAVIARVRAAGGVDADVPDDALTHLSLSLSVGLAMLDPVIQSGPTQASWNSLIARLGLSMAPEEMLLRPEHEARMHWRVFVDVADQPGGVDRFVRAMAAVHGYTLSIHVMGTGEGVRTLDMRLTAPAGVTEDTLRAAALAAGSNAYIAPGSPSDALDLSSRVLDWSTRVGHEPRLGAVCRDAAGLVPTMPTWCWRPRARTTPRTCCACSGPRSGTCCCAGGGRRSRRWSARGHRRCCACRPRSRPPPATRDARGWVEEVKDGTVWLRLAHPEDAAAVTAMHKRCSDRTLYLRYVSRGRLGRDPDAPAVRRAQRGHRGGLRRRRFDHRAGQRLPGAVRRGAHRRSRCCWSRTPITGRGIGTAMLRRQLRLAEQMGFAEVVAVVLAENGSDGADARADRADVDPAVRGRGSHDARTTTAGADEEPPADAPPESQESP